MYLTYLMILLIGPAINIPIQICELHTEAIPSNPKRFVPKSIKVSDITADQKYHLYFPALATIGFQTASILDAPTCPPCIYALYTAASEKHLFYSCSTMGFKK